VWVTAHRVEWEVGYDLWIGKDVEGRDFDVAKLLSQNSDGWVYEKF
jgi:hypothetical protein